MVGATTTRIQSKAKALPLVGGGASNCRKTLAPSAPSKTSVSAAPTLPNTPLLSLPPPPEAVLLLPPFLPSCASVRNAFGLLAPRTCGACTAGWSRIWCSWPWNLVWNGKLTVRQAPSPTIAKSMLTIVSSGPRSCTSRTSMPDPPQLSPTYNRKYLGNNASC